MDMNQTTPNSVNLEQKEAKAKLQKVKRQYFLASQGDEATTAIQSAMQLASDNGKQAVFNFDPEKEIPAGYDFVIAPINQRDTVNNVTNVVNISIGAIPTYELLLQTPEGATWVKEQVTNNVLAKLANAVRPNKAGEIASNTPFSVSDFITSNRSEGVLVAYRKYAPAYIKALKEKGLVNLIDATFRQILQSAAFAEQTFPSVPQAIWETVLTKMIAASEREGMIAGMLVDWKETRATAGLPDLREIDIEGLADLDI